MQSTGNSPYKLGDIDASELLLTDLYIGLRRSLFNWAKVTMQTPQARMGYIGQHLTSVVTGIQGGRSGARGHDLFNPATSEFFEIKTCTRVDQLGSCSICRSSVASIESVCPICDSTEIMRKDDSKWLITPQTDQDMRSLFDPKEYYLVLFDFVDMKTAAEINARIYSVDPQSWGFTLCMVDYWHNIRSQSKSKAPFNLWPFSLKFELMQPSLIYHAVIKQDDSIETHIFPGRDAAKLIGLSKLTTFSRATTLTPKVTLELCKLAGIKPVASNYENCANLQLWREQQNKSDESLIKHLNYLIYWDLIKSHGDWLPTETFKQLSKFKLKM